MKQNTLSFKEYILNTLFWNLIAYIWYKNIFFTPIKGCSNATSHLILGGIILLLFVINLGISGGWGKNEKSIIATTVLSYGVYAFITYSRYLGSLFIWISIVALILSITFILFIFCQKIKDKSKKRRIVRARFRRGYVGVRNIAACAGAIMIASVFIRTNFVGGLVAPTVKAEPVFGDEYSLSENIDEVLKLQPEIWDTLSVEEKLNVCAVVVDMECRYLGLNEHLSIYASKLDEGTLGYYSDSSKTIQIDVDHLSNDSSMSVTNTICHEVFHSAQHEYKNIWDNLDPSEKGLYFFMDVAEFADEFDNYIDGNENYYGYKNQAIEESARRYGLTSSQQIFERIDEYLEKNGN